MNNTVECPSCGLDNAYFKILDQNGAYFICPDCDYEWCDTSIKPEEAEEEADKDETFTFNKSNGGISVLTFQKLFSPRRQYQNRFLFSQENEEDFGVIERYANSVTDILFKTNNYKAISKVRLPEGLSKDRTNQIIKHEVKLYLESIDELPAFPSDLDWAAFIDAPIDLIKEIRKDHDDINSIVHFLPKTDEDGLKELFDFKLKQFYVQIKIEKFRYEEIVTKENLATILCFMFDGQMEDLKHEDPNLIADVRNFFKIELNLANTYRKDLARWKQGSFDNFFVEAKKLNLSKIDTVVLILSNYFKDLLTN